MPPIQFEAGSSCARRDSSIPRKCIEEPGRGSEGSDGCHTLRQSNDDKAKNGQFAANSVEVELGYGNGEARLLDVGNRLNGEKESQHVCQPYNPGAEDARDDPNGRQQLRTPCLLRDLRSRLATFKRVDGL